MARCEWCGENEPMPYNCRLCGKTCCGDHRLPENHDCPGLEDWGDPDGVFDSGFDDSVNNEGGSSGGVLSSLGISTGTGSVLGYFRGNMTYVFLGLMWITFVLQQLTVAFGTEALHLNLFILKSTAILQVWTWVTSVFAHGGIFHIFSNSIVLFFFGPIVEKRIGSKMFTILFLVTGAAAGLAQVGIAFALGNPSAVLGASGAIMAIMGVLTVLNPGLKVYLYFILPIPIWVLTGFYVGYSVFISSTSGIGAGGVAQFAHLTGIAIGLAYGVYLKRQGTSAPEELEFGGGGRGGGRRRRGRF